MLLLKSETRSELRMVIFIVFLPVIKNPPKISPGAYFRGGGAYYWDDICVKNQGGLFSGGGGLFSGGRGGGGAYYRDFTVLY